MGSVYQRAGRRGWYCQLRVEGRRVVRYGGATEAEARRFLAEVERQLAAGPGLTRHGPHGEMRP